MLHPRNFLASTNISAFPQTLVDAVNCNIKMQKNSEVKMYDNYKVKNKDGNAILIL